MGAPCPQKRCGLLWATGQAGASEAGSVMLRWGAWAPWGLQADEGWGERGPWPPELLASRGGRAGGGVRRTGYVWAKGSGVCRVLTQPWAGALPQPGAWWETGGRSLHSSVASGRLARGQQSHWAHRRRPSGAGTAWTEAGTAHFLTPEAHSQEHQGIGETQWG